MGLKLIYSAPKETAPETVVVPNNERRLIWGAIALFLIIKIPMLFVTSNPEEMRDFDHYLRMASGQTAFRDFVWLYGPLTPIVYGTFLKVLPERLLSLRLLTLCFWLVGVSFTARFLLRYLQRGLSFWAGIVFVTALSAYPSYSNNHILPAVALVASVFYLARYREQRELFDLHLSFFALAVVFFCRPVLMGYGVGALWAGLFLWDGEIPGRWRWASFYALCGLSGLLIFRFTYGPGVWSAFSPQPWAILETKAYPNLHYLVPHPRFLEGFSLFLKEIRAALETAVFYLHYFIWPTLILTLANLVKGRKEIGSAALTALFALMASLDLLHYGFSDPMSEQAMWVRGQYFFTGTAISLFLVLWPTIRLGRTALLRVAAAAVLFFVGVWAYMPWVVGVSHLVKYPKNQFNLPVLAGITTHGDRIALLQAVQFVNSLCRENDSVVFPQYEPGMARLLNCRDLFEKDSYIFTRMPWYVLSPHETPYAPEGRLTNGEVIQTRIASTNPRFFVLQGPSPYLGQCKLPGWQTKVFGEGSLGRTICYKP